MSRGGKITPNTQLPPGPDGGDRPVRVKRQVGTWLHSSEVTNNFASWCTQNHVRSRNSVRVVGSQNFARCLRTTRPIYPGQAIITAPLSVCFNFLVSTRLSFDQPNNFPLDCTWMNWNVTVPYMPSFARHEVNAAGWLCRLHSQYDDFWRPYTAWLAQDTTQRDGVAHGLQSVRNEVEHPERIDEFLTKICCDCAEEGDDFLENFFRLLGAYMGRSVPVEVAAVEEFMRGTGFLESKAKELFVPTLIPLIDAVPQDDTGRHNTMVQFFPGGASRQEFEDMDLELDAEQPIANNSFFALRAVTMIDEGEYLMLRSWPKTADAEGERYSSMQQEASMLMQDQTCV